MKNILMTAKMMKALNFTQQQLTEYIQYPNARLGFTHEKETFSSNMKHNDQSESYPIELLPIKEINENSCFQQAGFQNGDLLVSIHQGNHEYCYSKNSDGQISRFNIVTGKPVSTLDLKDNQSISVNFLRPKKHIEDRVVEKDKKNSNQIIVDNYHFVSKNINFYWLYEVPETNALKVQIRSYPLKNLENKIKEQIFNQDHAVKKIIQSLKINAAGFKEENKPIGAFLLTGPTGSGKTEMVKVLSKELGYPLVRFDMSEFGQGHQVARFLGSPAGYIGYNDTPLLEEIIGNSGKFCILLLDEMEKAHFDIQKIFLQAMDNGEITLSNNSKINFTNTMILMTSNCGVIQKSVAGISESSKLLSVDMEKIKESFLPEFIGRLSGVIEFNPIDLETSLKIIDKTINDFNEKHGSSKAKIILTSKARDYLLTNGFNQTYGARPLKQFINNQIVNKIAELILDSNGSSIGNIIVDCEDNEIILRNEQETIANIIS